MGVSYEGYEALSPCPPTRPREYCRGGSDRGGGDGRIDGCELPADPRNGFEELHGFGDGHLEDLGDRASTIEHLESLATEPLAATDIAGHIDVG